VLAIGSAQCSPNSSFKPTVFGRPVLSGMKTFDSVAQRRRLNFALGSYPVMSYPIVLWWVSAACSVGDGCGVDAGGLGPRGSGPRMPFTEVAKLRVMRSARTRNVPAGIRALRSCSDSRGSVPRTPFTGLVGMRATDPRGPGTPNPGSHSTQRTLSARARPRTHVTSSRNRAQRVPRGPVHAVWPGTRTRAAQYKSTGLPRGTLTRRSSRPSFGRPVLSGMKASDSVAQKTAA
jgi:hypothetical protein